MENKRGVIIAALLVSVIIASSFASAFSLGEFFNKITGRPIQETSGCYDSDAGKDYHSKGCVTSGSSELCDHCNSDGTLTEKYCSNNTAMAESVKCPEGYKCSESACIKSDCSSHSAYKCYNNHVYWFDSCSKAEEKKEYCEYGCSENACAGKGETIYYPKPFVKDGQSNLAIVIGSNAPTIDTLAGTDLSTSLQEACTQQNKQCKLGSIAVMDSEIQTVQDKNLIVIGRPCENSLTAKLLGIDTSICSSTKENFAETTCLSSGQFLIKSVVSPYNQNKIAVIIMGYGSSDTKNAASYIVAKKPATNIGVEMIRNANLDAVDSKFELCGQVDNKKKTCKELGGIECEEKEDDSKKTECDGTKTESSDIKNCCIGSCKNLLKKAEQEEEKENMNNSLCNSGCFYKEKCLPIGLRLEGSYCGYTGSLEKQKEKEVSCENNFECKSNICIDSKCLTKGFVQSIIEWLKRLLNFQE